MLQRTEKNRWQDTDEFERFAQTYGRSDSGFGFGDAEGLSLEVPLETLQLSFD
jgi:hypothetical protein